MKIVNSKAVFLCFGVIWLVLLLAAWTVLSRQGTVLCTIRSAAIFFELGRQIGSRQLAAQFTEVFVQFSGIGSKLSRYLGQTDLESSLTTPDACPELYQEYCLVLLI